VERGRSQVRVITTGIEGETGIEVVNGLKAGDQLVVKGFETLQDGSRVKILQ
jgi:hypothetical protein